LTDYHHRVKALFLEARELPQEQRQAWLEAACGGDDTLRENVISLLEVEDGMPSGFLTPLEGPVLAPHASVAQYEILERVGAGGMGEVWLAYDRTLERRVALKFPAGDFASDPGYRHYLRREARAAAGLEHAAVCRVFELGRVEGHDFIAMEYLEGETLAERLVSRPVPLHQALTWAAPIAGALEEAHGKGLVHGDLKPANVMVTRTGEVKVMDFGLARRFSRQGEAKGSTWTISLIDAGMMAGTPAYMAPERLKGQPADERSDIWAFGCLLFELLAGERVFSGMTSAEVAAAILEREPEWHKLPANVPPEIRKVLGRCLHKDPEQRPGDIGELRLAIEHATRQGALPTPGKGVARGSALPMAAATALRRPAYVAAAVLVAIALLGPYGIRRIRSEPAGAAPGARSVAVLPFVNMSEDVDNEYFSDGLSEQIIASLSRINGLRVAARTSSFALRARTLDVRAIGDTLGVGTVLEGSVRKDGERLRVTAQLIDAESGYHIWTEQYDRELQDIFALQDEIARAIADALELRLAGSGEVAAAGHRPSLEAYDLYLRGLFLRNSLREAALRQAQQFFDRAIELEPDFALAYAAKGSVLAPLVYFHYVPKEPALTELRRVVDRALRLDPELGEVYAVLGMLRLYFDWNWSGAEEALVRAIELNPSDAHAYHMLGNWFYAVGRYEEAVAAMQRASDLDPLNVRTIYMLGRDYDAAGDLDRALLHYQRAFEMDPAHPLALGLGPFLPRNPGEVYRKTGRNDDAFREYLEVAVLRGASESELQSMQAGYSESGMPGFWRAWVEMDLRQSGSDPDPVRLAMLFGLTGDTTQVVYWLERAYRERNPALIWLRSHDVLARYHTQPRVAEILRAMKFPER
jgi:TolB-like protein